MSPESSVSEDAAAREKAAAYRECVVAAVPAVPAVVTTIVVIVPKL